MAQTNSVWPAFLDGLAGQHLRMLRTRLELSHGNLALRALMITSGTPGAGKSLISASLALLTAQVHSKVLLIDASMCHPSLHHIFGGDNRAGLSTFLTHGGDPQQYILPTPMENLTFISAGPTPENSSDLLASPMFSEMMTRLRSTNDLIVIDSPSIVSGTPDPLLMAQAVDGVLFVVRPRHSRRAQDHQAVSLLGHTRAQLLGCIANESFVI